MINYDNAMDQLAAGGLEINGTPELGQLKRCKTSDDRSGKESGWYVLHEFALSAGDLVLVGAYGNWKTGLTATIELDKTRQLSDAERAAFREQMQATRRAAAVEREQRAVDCKSRAAKIWAALGDSGASDYLDKKQVSAWGVKFSRGSIVVPVRNIEGELLGLQFIAPDSTKRFLTGTPKKGAFHFVGDDSPRTPLAIAEGYATAATVHQATGWPCVVAFDAGNLMPVCRALRDKWPERELIICGDDDTETEGNPGRTKATLAAQAVGARVVFPGFDQQKKGVLE